MDKYIQQEKSATITAGDTTTLNFQLASQDGTLTGIVTNKDTSAPIVGAKVSVNDNSTQTDTSGSYQFSLYPGSYTVTVSVDKYIQQEKLVTITAGDTTTLNFQLVLQSGILTGVVTDSDTSAPIAGATVNVNGSSAQTDISGTYQFTLSPGNYTAIASADRYVQQQKSATMTAGDTTTLNFQLTPADGTLTGAVTDSETSAPISGATVTANGGSIQTDADGTYQFGLNPGNYTVTVVADKYVSQEKSITITSGDSITLDFQLVPQDGILAGTVTDSETSAPIAGATVSVNGSSAQTDTNGMYQFTLRPSSYAVIILAEKYAQQGASVTITAGDTTTLDFQLVPLDGTLIGIVTDSETSEPIAGAVVNGNGSSVQTDTSGTYQFALSAGNYTITVSAEGYVQQGASVTITAGDTTILDFQLVPLDGTLIGIVTDSETSEPIAGAVVNGNGSSVQTDTDGTYQFTLSRGDYTVTASAEGYAQQEKSVTITAGDAATLDFQLAPLVGPKGTLTGTVTNRDTSAPIAGAEVYVGDISVQTDASGKYQFTLPVRDYTVTVSADGYIQQEETAIIIADDSTILDFQLAPMDGTLSGMVVDRVTSAPIAGARVEVNGSSAQTDTSGTYRLTLGVGSYTATVLADGYVQQEKSVTIIAGGITVVGFQLTPQKGILTGIVTDRNTSAPIVEAAVVANGSSDKTDTRGMYQFTLDSGSYTVTVSAEGYIQQQKTTTVTAGDTTTLSFQLTPADGILTGTVMGKDTAAPIAGAAVAANGSSDQTDASGVYRFALDPGNYTVTVSAEGYIEQNKPVTITADDTATLDFQLAPVDGILIGTIVNEETGAPVPNATVEVVEGQNVVARGKTDSLGKFEFSLPPGTYDVVALAEGYIISEQSLAINSGETEESQFMALAAVEVWPGDTSNNGRVSIIDVLPIGRFWNERGDKRQPQATEWQAGLTPIANWNSQEAALADADGNGVVDEDDILVIVENWKKTQTEGRPAPEPYDTMQLLADRSMLDKYQKMYQALNQAGDSEGAVVLRNALSRLIDELKPKENILLPNYPNPFNPETWMPFVLAEEAEVEIRIYDVRGRLVRELRLGRLGTGYYIQKGRAGHWDGRNESGELVASGVYIYQLTANGRRLVRKMVVMR